MSSSYWQSSNTYLCYEHSSPTLLEQYNQWLPLVSISSAMQISDAYNLLQEAIMMKTQNQHRYQKYWNVVVAQHIVYKMAKIMAAGTEGS
jgi:hypothetical protein